MKLYTLSQIWILSLASFLLTVECMAQPVIPNSNFDINQLVPNPMADPRISRPMKTFNPPISPQVQQKNLPSNEIPIPAQPNTYFIKKVPDANLDAIKAILEKPEDQISEAEAILIIDRGVDPSINVADNLKLLDKMAERIKTKLPKNATDQEKLEALRSYIYDAGPWNNNQPFKYDLDDPLGNNIKTKLLPTYIATKKGNCISMPLLFMLLGQRLGIDLALTTVPEHTLVKWRDRESGKYYNIEATSGGLPARDVWINQQHPMTDKAIASGIYLRPLSKKETIVEEATPLLELYAKQIQPERMIYLANLLLEYDPKNVTAMLELAAAYHLIEKSQFESKYPQTKDIPLEKRQYFMEVEYSIDYWFKRAEALGWREPTKEDNEKYTQIVNQVKLDP